MSLFIVESTCKNLQGVFHYGIWGHLPDAFQADVSDLEVQFTCLRSAGTLEVPMCLERVERGFGASTTAPLPCRASSRKHLACREDCTGSVAGHRSAEEVRCVTPLPDSRDRELRANRDSCSRAI